MQKEVSTEVFAPFVTALESMILHVAKYYPDQVVALLDAYRVVIEQQRAALKDDAT
jgi:hypothetical protein